MSRIVLMRWQGYDQGVFSGIVGNDNFVNQSKTCVLGMLERVC